MEYLPTSSRFVIFWGKQSKLSEYQPHKLPKV